MADPIKEHLDRVVECYLTDGEAPSPEAAANMRLDLAILYGVALALYTQGLQGPPA